MKSILIPTDYSEDTLHAMELTWRNAGKDPVKIVLLSLSALPDSESQLFFLSDSDDSDLNREKRLLDEWEIRKSLLGISTGVVQHHQYGASRPIIGQIIEQYQINAIIIPFSIQNAENDVYKEALQSLKDVGYKVILMPERQASLSLSADRI